MIPARKTRTIHVRDLPIGGEAPIVVQSMAATRTRDVQATIRQVQLLEEAGADLVRIAVDSKADVEALAEIRASTQARLSVDLQENYRLAELVAPHVDKIRYNPGHLHHHEKEKPVAEKVAYLVEVARANPDVIDDPAPYGLFTGFGDSSLDFELRAWTESGDAMTIVRSDLAVGIQDALAAANIEVPFPQRDLHVKIVPT